MLPFWKETVWLEQNKFFAVSIKKEVSCIRCNITSQGEEGIKIEGKKPTPTLLLFLIQGAIFRQSSIKSAAFPYCQVLVKPKRPCQPRELCKLDAAQQPTLCAVGVVGRSRYYNMNVTAVQTSLEKPGWIRASAQSERMLFKRWAGKKRKTEEDRQQL